MTRAPKMRAAPGWAKAQIVSVGHSTRPIDELMAILEEAHVKTVADVRTIPRSRANPQYEGPALARSLAEAGIEYAHVPELGGLRHARKDSPNLGWRNASFRGYADYMATAGFEDGLRRLRELAEGGPVALLCAEAVPWRCHRSLIADALLARGVTVQHLMGHHTARPHQLTSFAALDGRKVTYPAIDAE